MRIDSSHRSWMVGTTVALIASAAAYAYYATT